MDLNDQTNQTKISFELMTELIRMSKTEYPNILLTIRYTLIKSEYFYSKYNLLINNTPIIFLTEQALNSYIFILDFDKSKVVGVLIDYFVSLKLINSICYFCTLDLFN